MLKQISLSDLQKRLQELSPKCDSEVLEFISYLLLIIEELVRYLSLDSHNSHKPPSTDGFDKRANSSLREPSGKKAGGQEGHKGETLKMVANPQKVIRYQVANCKVCARRLTDGDIVEIKKRQVFDLPPLFIRVTEHQVEVKRCRCGTINEAKFPEGVNQPVEYGERLKGAMVYFSNYQLLPYERTVEIFRDLFSHNLSGGTLYNANQECYQKLEETEGGIKGCLVNSAVVNFDETGMYSRNKRQWLHAASTENLTYYAIDQKRGKEAMERIGILPRYRGAAVHDHWSAYNEYDCKHAFCNVHHLRELNYAYEVEGADWAKEMKQCLLDIKEAVDQAKESSNPSLEPAVIGIFEKRYDWIIEEGLQKYSLRESNINNTGRGRKKQSKGKNLLDRLQKHKEGTLAFMKDFVIPFDNNLVERDERMAKVKQKISGCFRSQEGARFFCRIRGYISTIRKHGRDVIEEISGIFKGTHFKPGLDTG